MKTINKYILASCVFCYFAGIYLAAEKTGILRLLSRNGLSWTLDEWPDDFPSKNFVYICLAIYTIFFVIITYVIYRNIVSHGKDMDMLQEKSFTLHNYSEGLALVVTHYNRICREKNISNKTQSQRLQLLEKQVSSLPASVLNNSNASCKIARIIRDLDDAVSNMDTTVESDILANNVQFCNLVERSIEDVQRLKTNSVTIK